MLLLCACSPAGSSTGKQQARASQHRAQYWFHAKELDIFELLVFKPRGTDMKMHVLQRANRQEHLAEALTFNSSSLQQLFAASSLPGLWSSTANAATVDSAAIAACPGAPASQQHAAMKLTGNNDIQGRMDVWLSSLTAASSTIRATLCRTTHATVRSTVVPPQAVPAETTLFHPIQQAARTMPSSILNQRSRAASGACLTHVFGPAALQVSPNSTCPALAPPLAFEAAATAAAAAAAAAAATATTANQTVVNVPKPATTVHQQVQQPDMCTHLHTLGDVSLCVGLVHIAQCCTANHTLDAQQQHARAARGYNPYFGFTLAMVSSSNSARLMNDVCFSPVATTKTTSGPHGRFLQAGAAIMKSIRCLLNATEAVLALDLQHKLSGGQLLSLHLMLRQLETVFSLISCYWFNLKIMARPPVGNRSGTAHNRQLGMWHRRCISC
jgi:hypothetical protein